MAPEARGDTMTALPGRAHRPPRAPGTPLPARPAKRWRTVINGYDDPWERYLMAIQFDLADFLEGGLEE